MKIRFYGGNSMLFNSYAFIFIFLPIVIAVFGALRFFGNRYTALPAASLASIWLVLSSLFFYGWWNPVYVFLLLASVGVNFTIGMRLSRSPARNLLIFGILINLGLLAYFKYTGFFAHIAGLYLPDIILPLAISFFTFQQIAFLIDAYQGKIQDRGFVHYCLFVTFFPQLIAGPILRHNDIVPQFSDRKLFGLSARNIAIGLTFFAIGLFKKTVIADSMAGYANPVFTMADQGGNVTTTDAWIGTLAYSFQLYFDFSAYSDMAVGLARIFGIQLPLNFFSPYKSANIVDFWRRWHITLSRFLRDYLYIPLGGNKRGKARRYAAVIITMLLGGLWHGAAWNFIIWGGIHGIFIVINHMWKALSKKYRFTIFNNLVGQICAIILTFSCVTFSWIFFRAGTWDGAITIITAMAGGTAGASPRQSGLWGDNDAAAAFIPSLFPVTELTLALFAGVALLTFVAPNTAQFMRRTLREPASGDFAILNHDKLVPFVQKIMPVWKINILYAALLAVIAAAAILSVTKISPFLYFQF